MMDSQLMIRDFHVTDISWDNMFSMTRISKEHFSHRNLWKITIPKHCIKKYVSDEDLIESIDLQILTPDMHHRYVNSIMDVIPISTKVLGRVGEGITHTLTGVYVILTGVDTEGTPVCAFGNSDGMLDEQMIFGKAGTPDKDDLILLFDVTLKAKAGFSRSGPDAAHRACDSFCQEIRNCLKQLKGSSCTEKHVYENTKRPGKKKVVLVKLVSGQGAMYDTHFLGDEPSAFSGSHSVIDITGAPVVLTPNEYRDGAIRAMY